MKRTNHQIVVALLAASIDAMKSLKKDIGMKHHILLLAVLLSVLLPAGTQAADAPLVQDPNFPLIRLPAEFDSHRTTKRVDLGENEAVEILNVQGPGCVRHFWITASASDVLQIEITSDGTREPQVKMKMDRFFGLLLGQKPYRIESAPIKLLPKSGFNSYFPIPFQSSCKIVLRNVTKHKTPIWSMVNWHKYAPEAKITPLRLHAEFTAAKGTDTFGSVLLGSIEGRGFVAGMLHAISRQDNRDMVWHTGGDTWLIDGETNPHVLRGIGSEDVFCYSFGVYKDLSEWVGGPHAIGENANCSSIVAYRFFGIDSVAFKSSMVLRFGTLANPVENVLYYYKDGTVRPVAVETPQKWTLSGPFDAADSKAFEDATLPDEVVDGAKKEWKFGNRTMRAVETTPECSWIDFSRWYRFNAGGNVGTQPHDCAAYAKTVVTSKQARKAILRLGFDDWAKIWINGKPVATLKHEDGLKTAEIPISLAEGEHQLVIRLSNFNNVEWRCWAFSCVIE